MGEIVYSGTVKNIHDGKQYDCHMKIIHKAYLSDILALQEHTINLLEDKTICLPSSVYDWERMLEDEGVVIGTFANGSLIGCISALFPGKGEDNLAKYTDLPPLEWELSCHLELCYVNPDFRGNSLQIKMTSCLINKLKEVDKWRYLLTTVYPFNYASLTDVLQHNLLIIRLEKMYSGVWRYLLIQDYKNSILPDRDNFVAVDSSNFDGQMELLNQGYIGFKLQKDDKNQKSILFGKRQQEL
jgi:hypothetical protein